MSKSEAVVPPILGCVCFCMCLVSHVHYRLCVVLVRLIREEGIHCNMKTGRTCSPRTLFVLQPNLKKYPLKGDNAKTNSRTKSWTYTHGLISELGETIFEVLSYTLGPLCRTALIPLLTDSIHVYSSDLHEPDSP